MLPIDSCVLRTLLVKPEHDPAITVAVRDELLCSSASSPKDCPGQTHRIGGPNSVSAVQASETRPPDSALHATGRSQRLKPWAS
jgi:hypothetical protein